MSRRLVVTTGIAGVLVAITGVGVLASRAAREAGFGWFAYAPVSQEQLDGLVALNGARVLGAVLVAAGLALVAFAAGARAARAGARLGSLRGIGVVGGLVVVAGLVTLLRPRTVVALGDEPPVSTSSTLLPVQLVGLAVALVGVLLLAAVLGALAARPRAEPASG